MLTYSNRYDARMVDGNLYLHRGDASEAVRCFEEAWSIEGITPEQQRRAQHSMAKALLIALERGQQLPRYIQRQHLEEAFGLVHELTPLCPWDTPEVFIATLEQQFAPATPTT